jgi:hypothetical protein
MDTISKVDAEGVETVFSRNEKVSSILQVMRESNKSVLSCYQQTFYLSTIERKVRERAIDHGDAGNRTPVTSMSKDIVTP